MRKLILSCCVFLAGILVMSEISAQALNAPRPSQKSVVTQTIGLSEVSVTYSRPSVNDREIWGTLVPYGQVWRAGANENTFITFSSDAKVGAQDIKAGTYGLHILPNEGADWTVIFSNNASSWGSFSYNQDEDAARVNVTPREAAFRETLTYDFINIQAGSAELVLNWGKMEIPLTISVDVHNLVIASFKDQLRSIPGFTWIGWNQAANYCATNNVELEQGLQWVQTSIQNQENFTNNNTKSQLLTKLGREEEAKAALERGLTKATALELHQYGRTLIGQNKPEEAMKIFKMNVKQNPDVWFVSVGMARGYQALKDNKNAIKYWKKSIEVAPENQRPFYENLLAQLEQAN